MYKILINYGSDGMKFDDGKYFDINNAVSQAIKVCYGMPFFIVKIIEWKATGIYED